MPPSVLPLLLLLLINFPATVRAVKCFDCHGTDGSSNNTCEGDYCVLAHYAPTWGSLQLNYQSPLIRGCFTGKMFAKDIQSNCETTHIEFPFEGKKKRATCFCNNKDYCNGENAVEELEHQNITLHTCVCEGPHCHSEETCLGEFCTYVIDHKTWEIEKGCVNATVPLMERRFFGSSCTMPPATGIMHNTRHTKSPRDLLHTEACICEGDYCNFAKLKQRPSENMKCDTRVQFEMAGMNFISENVTCTGEYCFSTKFNSSIGFMRSYSSVGCLSFMQFGEALAEEKNASGCAKFDSENIQVEACLKKDNTDIYDDYVNVKFVKTTPSYRYFTTPETKKEATTTIPSYTTPKTKEGEATTMTVPFYSTFAPASYETSSNAYHIIVFLIVIIAVALVGVGYKLELHKKLLRPCF